MTLPRLKGGGPALGAADHDRNMLLLGGFPSLADMLADTARGYGFYAPGQTILVLKEGFRYAVAPPDAADHHLATAAGLKLRVLPSDDGGYNFQAFNPAADGVTDDYAKLMMAINAVAEGQAPHRRGPTINFAAVLYRFNSTIELNTTVTLLGSQSAGSGTVFVFPTGVSGIVVNDFNTGKGTAISEAEATSLGLSGAGGSVIEGIVFRGQSVPTARGNAAGLWLRAPATIRDCAFNQFNGYGALIDASAPADLPASPNRWGDARGWYMHGVSCVYNGRSGLRVRGTRSGGGVCILGNFVYSGFWSIDDHQPGGNIYLACHSATNAVGLGAGNFSEPRKSSCCHYQGFRYYAVYKTDGNGDHDPAHLQALVDTVPGTDPTVWRRGFAGGEHPSYPTWVSGRPVGQFFPGGGYKITHPDSTSVNLGSYSESDDGIGNVYVGNNVISIGGIQAAPPESGHILGGNGGRLTLYTGASIGTDDLRVRLMRDRILETTLSFEKNGEVWDFLRWYNEDLAIMKEGSEPVFKITGNLTDEEYGTGVPVRYIPHTPVMGLGDRRHIRLPAAPTTGEWAKGDIVWNRDPSAGGNAGWICTAGGTPGTWKACLPIAT